MCSASRVRIVNGCASSVTQQRISSMVRTGRGFAPSVRLIGSGCTIDDDARGLRAISAFEQNDGFDLWCRGKQVVGLDGDDAIARVNEDLGVARPGVGVAGHEHDPRRGQ